METQELQQIKNKFDIVGNDISLNLAIETAIKVSPVDIPVLISGESGVGKEVFPKIIHQYSKRKNSKYFAINCGAIPEGTIDSELFGHEKGSFTGAIESRKGYFAEADGGTLFLDEIGELPMSSQAKLLRVLQSGEYIKVGSSKVEKTDVRVIAATNINLSNALSKGTFREDLFYRLNAVQINLLPLRERKDDIYLLFRKFSSDFSEKNGRQKISLNNEAIRLLINYRWPGNIRQLKNIAEAVAAIEAPAANPKSLERFEIDAHTLSKYMPKDDYNTLPVLSNRPENISDTEKRRIFELLHTLTNEVAKLKQAVTGMEIQGSFQLHENVDQKIEIKSPSKEQEENVIDIQDQVYPNDTPVNYSVRENYVELIKKALDKHNGNRRKAARELGISERTLYRKLSNGTKQ